MHTNVISVLECLSSPTRLADDAQGHHSIEKLDTSVTGRKGKCLHSRKFIFFETSCALINLSEVPMNNLDVGSRILFSFFPKNSQNVQTQMNT